MAQKALKAGKQTEAVNYYQETLRLEPNSADAHYQLGLILAKQGKSAEARIHLSKAAELKPDYASALKNLDKVSDPQKKT